MTSNMNLAKVAYEFTEARILKLLSTKPSRLSDSQHAKVILRDLRKLRSYALDPSRDLEKDYRIKLEKGWGSFLSRTIYVATTSRIAKLELLIEALAERITQLEADERQQAEALRRSRQAAKHFARAGQDKALVGALLHALDNAPPIVGFVYLKRWTLADGSCWYKVGVTNDPDRREAEQNVLPVASETIACVDVGSMDRARAIEGVIHQVLKQQRITDANNRELFQLSVQQVSAVKAVLEKLVC